MLNIDFDIINQGALRIMVVVVLGVGVKRVVLLVKDVPVDDVVNKVNVQDIEQVNLPKIMVILVNKVEIKTTSRRVERKSFVVHGIYTPVRVNPYDIVDFVYRVIIELNSTVNFVNVKASEDEEEENNGVVGEVAITNCEEVL